MMTCRAREEKRLCGECRGYGRSPRGEHVNMDSLAALSQLGYSRPLVAEALKQVNHFCSLHLGMVHSLFVILRMNLPCFSEDKHFDMDVLAALNQLGYSRPVVAEALKQAEHFCSLHLGKLCTASS